MNRKYAGFVAMGALTMLFMFYILSNHTSNEAYSGLSGGVNCGQALKALALALTDKEECLSVGYNYFPEKEKDSWYVPYMNYLYSQNIIDMNQFVPASGTAQGYLTCGQLKKLADVLELEEMEIFDRNEQDTPVTEENWQDVYKRILKKYDSAGYVARNHITVYQTAANLSEAKPWEAYTDIGKLGFDGLALDYYLGKQILVMMRGSEIIHVLGEEERIEIEEPEIISEQTLPEQPEEAEQSIDQQLLKILIQTTGYAEKLHDSVSITSVQAFTVTSGQSQISIGPGETLTLTGVDALWGEGTVLITPAEGAELTISSITRAQGSPSYPGSLELSLQGSQIAVVNIVEMEEYLKRVVPSEMPARYGFEAAKIQAVCARTYIYQKLLSGNYPEYGALVDDSSNYQVYNGIGTRDVSSQGIEATKGQILAREGQVIMPYYFSTSCGYTADNQIWGGNAQGYPYLKAQAVSEQTQVLDLANEQVFREFIMNKEYPSYEVDFTWYRWQYALDIDSMAAMIESRLPALIASRPQHILTQNADGSLGEAISPEIGKIVSIDVVTRYAGGIVAELKISGTKQTVVIRQESNIRVILGAPHQTYENKSQNGSAKSEGNYLPSAFFCLEPVTENGALTGYTIYGGGNGHGIGMPQNGAYAMTMQGKSYAEILAYFYPGTEITQIP